MEFKKFLEEMKDEQQTLELMIGYGFVKEGDTDVLEWTVEFKKTLIHPKMFEEFDVLFENSDCMPFGNGLTLKAAIDELIISIRGKRLEGFKKTVPYELELWVD